MNSSPSNSQNNFSTKRLQLAIFLHASQKLRFVGLEPDGNGRDIRFVFHDPDARGDELELAYESGQPVSAIALFASQKFLRRQMSATLDKLYNRKPGETRHEYQYRTR